MESLVFAMAQHGHSILFPDSMGVPAETIALPVARVAGRHIAQMFAKFVPGVDTMAPSFAGSMSLPMI